MLEELTYSAERGDRASIIDGAILCENPLERIQRYIKERFWVSLTRRLDAEVIELAVKDTKIPGWGGTPIIYVPHAAEKQLAYYNTIAAQRPSLGLQVIPLPAQVTNKAYKEILKNPGILALDTEEYVDPVTGLVESRAVPFAVPGGRFNEFFGWDSYFMGLGLLRDGRADLVKGLLRNWVFEIQHYGMIPNANRSYLMLRSQPPFLTDLSLRLYEATKHEASAKDLLRLCLQAAIKEYHRVWTCHPRLDDATGLSKYCPVGGFGIPNEVEPGHFDSVLRPFAERHGMSIEKFTAKFNDGLIDEPGLRSTSGTTAQCGSPDTIHQRVSTAARRIWPSRTSTSVCTSTRQTSPPPSRPSSTASSPSRPTSRSQPLTRTRSHRPGIAERKAAKLPWTRTSGMRRGGRTLTTM